MPGATWCVRDRSRQVALAFVLSGWLTRGGRARIVAPSDFDQPGEGGLIQGRCKCHAAVLGSASRCFEEIGRHLERILEVSMRELSHGEYETGGCLGVDIASTLLTPTQDESPTHVVSVISTSHKRNERVLVQWSGKKIVESRGSLVDLLKNMGLKKTRATLTFSADEIEIKEFTVRLGKAVNEHEGKLFGSYVAITCEFIKHIDEAAKMLEEFLTILQGQMDQFMYKLSPVVAPWSEFNLGKQFTCKHEALLFACLCQTFLNPVAFDVDKSANQGTIDVIEIL